MANVTSEQLRAMGIAVPRDVPIAPAGMQSLAQSLPPDPLEDLNKTERAYADSLARRKRSGEIRDYLIQAMTFKLGPHLRYTPDFVVIESDGTFTAIDTKGTYTREDAIVKFKAAAQRFPWIRWQMIEYAKGKFTVARSLNDWKAA